MTKVNKRTVSPAPTRSLRVQSKKPNYADDPKAKRKSPRNNNFSNLNRPKADLTTITHKPVVKKKAPVQSQQPPVQIEEETESLIDKLSDQKKQRALLILEDINGKLSNSQQPA